jgi:uncharacterized protein (DUF1684 family)
MRLVWPTLLTIALAAPASPADDAYRAAILKWREQREARLKADDGWLTVAGLFWLREGGNALGSAPGSAIALPAGAAPASAGTIQLSGRQVTLQLAPGVAGRVGGRLVSGSMTLKPDSAGEPDILELGRLSLFVIERGGRLAVRLRDRENAARLQFAGLHWFDVSEAYRVTARYVSYPKPKPVIVPNVLGRMETMPSPGYAEFMVQKQTVRLDGVLEEPDAKQLFFIFSDATSGKETYPSGRFLYADLPTGDTVTLDFNKAYNPPCAFTAFATCPLPPKQNVLRVRIEAGEKTYGKGH